MIVQLYQCVVPRDTSDVIYLCIYPQAYVASFFKKNIFLGNEYFWS